MAMKKGLKHLACDFAILLAVLVVVDLLCGFASEKLIMKLPNCNNELSHTKQSFFNQKADILILGSSRAVHHYNPEILEDSLGMSAYNGGRDGMGIMYNYSVLKATLTRHCPKIVVLDINGSAIDGDWTNKEVGNKAYYWMNPYTKEVIDELTDFPDNLLLYSGLYRGNDLPLRMVKTFMMGDSDFKGYNAKPTTREGMKAVYKDDEEDFVFDSLSRVYFDKIVSACRENDIRLVLSYSPSLTVGNGSMMRQIGEIAKDEGLQVINAERDTSFLNHPELFTDMSHLNCYGATKFTVYVASELKR